MKKLHKLYKAKGVLGDTKEAEFLVGVYRDSDGLISLSILSDSNTEQIVIPINRIIEDLR